MLNNCNNKKYKNIFYRRRNYDFYTLKFNDFNIIQLNNQ